jgi:SAM-dependent methyltransferase
MNRRDCLARLGALLATSFAGPLAALENDSRDEALGNFLYVYSNPELRRQFFEFLINVFHLFPEDEFQDALVRLSQPGVSDQQIYEALQNELSDIKPFLGDLTYALPALKKQKAIMGDQTQMLLDVNAVYEGHLEIGSTGRYVGTLAERLQLSGEIFLLHTKEPGYGPEDIVERGQLGKIGTYIDMGDYSSEFANIIPENSIGLATVYIGFHHCPVDKREEFISSVRDVIKPGGKLILRDHDAHNEDLWRVAALAHDTFNAGTDENWQFNADELRNFYSLRFIIDFLENVGFKHDGHVYFQNGDPTRNALTAFTKV